MSTRNSYKINRVAMILVLIAFLTFAGFATFSVSNIASTVEDKIVISQNDMPESWATISSNNMLRSTFSARVVNNDYIEYTLSLKNVDSDHSASISHFSSYLTQGDNKGFATIVSNSLEYTYTNEDISSWTAAQISQPGNNTESFKLGGNVYVGKAGSATDTVYFRYLIAPAEEGTVRDKISILAKTDSGVEFVVADSNEIAYQKPDDVRLAAENLVKENPTIALRDPNDESGEYTQPLGVESEPTSTVISTSSLGAIALSPSLFNGNIIAIVSALGIFALTLIIYLVVRKRNA